MWLKNTKELGKIVRAKRKEQKITQVDLAGLAGTGVRFIVDLEAGKQTCQLQKTLNVLNLLGIRFEVKE